MSGSPIIRIESYDSDMRFREKANENFAILARAGENDRLRSSVSAEIDDKVSDPSKLPDIGSWFNFNDPGVADEAIVGGAGGATFTDIILRWDLSPNGLFRRYAIFEGVTANFMGVIGSDFDTEGHVPLMVVDQTVITISGKERGSGPWYYCVIPMNLEDEYGVPTYLGPFTCASIPAQTLPTYSELKTQIIAGGGIDLGEAGVVTGALAAEHIAAEDLSVYYAEVSGTANIANVFAGSVTTDQIVAGTAAISSALIGDLSAAKITSGQLNCSVVEVINLDAGRITTGTLTGIVIKSPGSNAGDDCHITIENGHIKWNKPTVTGHAGVAGADGDIWGGMNADVGMLTIKAPCPSGLYTPELALITSSVSGGQTVSITGILGVSGRVSAPLFADSDNTDGIKILCTAETSVRVRYDATNHRLYVYEGTTGYYVTLTT